MARGRSSLALMAGLCGLNAALWSVAAAIGLHAPGLLAPAFVAWTFGLRHALDADHIAAIDVVTRRLLARAHKPIFVGLFFSLGHSTVVIVATYALLHLPVHTWLENWHLVGGLVGGGISIAFLLVMALLSALAARTQWVSLKTGRPVTARPAGVLMRLLAPLTDMIRHERQMYYLGFLFGLGFDTATEIGLLGLATSSQAAAPTWALMLLPLLFTAAMMLMDSLDTVLMIRAWTWSAHSARRRAHYTISVTALSAAAAFAVALLELAQMPGIAERVPRWAATVADAADAHFPLLGAGLVFLFLGLWGVTALRGARDSKTTRHASPRC
ncbi:hydrolase [Acetobacter suratthaniensis]|uniref:Nickel/cobalt efflux system n=1 Tax=Acetobacter suratthaniensis TaxID=1502841 RepID=A0ABS3LLC2_9PROT|nr:hydrolase [Acetobacter suratthaniensis]MBO1328164.1 hydrolase [Acetobacter suratthaniensis]MCX2566284.1 hydrolase [Acetobacter suratthaniensis]